MIQCLTYQDGTITPLATPGFPSCTPFGATNGHYFARLSPLTTQGSTITGATVVDFTNGSNNVLTPPTGVYFYDYGLGVNSQGQAAATLLCPATASATLPPSTPGGPPPYISCAYLMSNKGTFTALRDIGNGSGAVSINAAGDVAGWVGQLGKLSPNGAHATIWSHTGEIIDLTTLTTFQAGLPVFINAKGQVIGTAFGGTTQSGFGYLYDGAGKFAQIQIAGAASTIPQSLNDSGEVVGAYRTGPEDTIGRAFYYANGTAVDLNAMVTNAPAGMFFTSASYINNSGQILATAVYTSQPVGVVANGTAAVQFLLTPVKAASVSASPTSLSFSYQTLGAPPAAQSIQVTASGGAAVAFNAAATSDGGWLSVTPTSGTTPASVNVSVNGAGLALGVHTGQIVLTTGTDATSRTVIPVTMTVGATPVVSASVPSLSFTFMLGASLPAPQTVQVAALGDTAVSFTAKSSCAGLSVTPASGATPTPLSVSVTKDILAGVQIQQDMAIGCSLAITPAIAGGAQISIPVNVFVTVAPIVISPSRLKFTYQIGDSLPPAQTIQVTGRDNAAVVFSGFPYNWVSVTPSKGTTPATLMVSVGPAGLSAGTYTESITINGSSLDVTLTITGKGTAPGPTITSVVNAASFAPGTSANTWITIQGTNLSTTTRSWTASDFVDNQLPTSLDDVTVWVGSLRAYPSYISPTQLNVLAPDDATTGSVDVLVKNAFGYGSTFKVNKMDPMPALFTVDAQHVAARHADGRAVGPTNLIAGGTFSPAAPGEVIQLFGTGFGASAEPVPSGQILAVPVALASQVTVTIGGQAAIVQFAGMSASGLDQLNITVPDGLPDGDAAIVASVGGVSTQANLKVSVKK